MGTQHDRIVAQRQAAQALVGRRVVFHHRADEELVVEAATIDGMVRVTRYVGEFSPFLFHVLEDEERPARQA